VITTSFRVRSAVRASAVHLVISFAIALAAAALVFGIWYPFPFRDLAGGRELFWLVVSIDVVCGPLLTLVLFNPAKIRLALVVDLGLVAIVQSVALGYGIFTAWEARPLYLVLEVDRFRVISIGNLEKQTLAILPTSLQTRLFSPPITVAIRPSKDAQERNRVLFESVQGGRDFAERPEFYLPYDGDAALTSLKRAKPLVIFLEKFPKEELVAQKIAVEKKANIADWFYLPVQGRQDWVVILDKTGMIQGFLKGDGF
jgi:hypothetical protein